MLNKISNESLKSCITLTTPLTPFKVTLIIIIRNYLKSKCIYDKLLENNGCSKRSFIIALLHIMQNEDMTLYEILNVMNSLCSDLAKETLINLNNLCIDKQTYKLYKFLTDFDDFVEEQFIIIPKSSIIYLYITKILESFRQYWFEDVIKLHLALCHYYYKYFDNQAIKINHAKQKPHEPLCDFMQNNDYNNATKYVRKCAELQLKLPLISDDNENKNDDYMQYQDFSKAFSMGSYNMAVVQQKFGYSEMASNHLKEALQIIYTTRDFEMLDKCQTFLQNCQISQTSTLDSFIFKQEIEASKLSDPQKDEILEKNICFTENPHILKASILRAQYLVETNGHPTNIMEMLLMRPEKGCDSVGSVTLKSKLKYEAEDFLVQQTTRLILSSTLSQIYGIWPEHSSLLIKLAKQPVNNLLSSKTLSPNLKSMAMCQEARLLHLKGDFEGRDIVANELGFPNPYLSDEHQMKDSKNLNCLEDVTKIALLEIYIEYGVYQPHNMKWETQDTVKILLQQLRDLDINVAQYWEAQYNYVCLKDYYKAYEISKSLIQNVEKISTSPLQSGILSNLQYQYLRIKALILKSQILLSTNQFNSARDNLIECLAVCYDHNLYSLAVFVLFHFAQVKSKMGQPSDIVEAFILSNFTRAHMPFMSYGYIHSTRFNEIYDDIKLAYYKLSQK